VAQETVDETTGLTSWSTVKIKRTTVRQELKEERARSRQKRKEAAQEADKQQREADARKMEEAKVSNADDSALGAYDVWSRTKDGYKGVDIHGEAAVDIHEMGKKLSDGKGAIGFKKSAFKAKKKKQNRRTTSADDDDD
jgi:WW domain-binding protein 4